ncbi:MAG TPA: hypothetical protein VEZ48_13280 [Sphingomonadaceae bacterium]|nr:hypothetical protein [Sphingomonadaceae bacterium]
MRDRDRLATMTRLAAVQRAKRVGAEAALGEARRVEAEAETAQADAQARLVDAHEQWLGHMEAGRFSPELAGLLSNAVVGRAGELDQAEAQTATAADARARSQSEWQVLEARVRAGEDGLRDLRRKVARRREESRVAERADRTTLAWSRT